MIFTTLAFALTLGVSTNPAKHQIYRLWGIILCTCIGIEMIRAHQFSRDLGMALLSGLWRFFCHISVHDPHVNLFLLLLGLLKETYLEYYQHF